MADQENIRVCPVCFHDYQFQGEHVPRMLACFHTVCEGCIRDKLWQGKSFRCPQCGTKHSSKHGFISNAKKIAERQPAETKSEEGKNECSMHGREYSFFCKESGCQMAICVACALEEHQGHEYGDLEEVTEEMCISILEDVEWMKDALKEKKDGFLKVQKIMVDNCRECASEVKDLQTYITRKINQRVGNLFHYITEHQNKTDFKTNKAIDTIDEHLAVLKDFEKIAKNKTVLEIEMNTLEKFKRTKDEIKSRFLEPTRYTILNYAKCGEITRCLSELCGKLKLKDRRIEMKVMEPDPNCATASPETFSSDISSSERHPNKINETAVPVAKNVSMDQSSTTGKAADGDLQAEDTQAEVVQWVDSLLAKAAKLLPSITSVAPDVTYDNSPCLQKDLCAENIQAAGIVATKSPNNSLSLIGLSENLTESNDDFTKTAVNFTKDIQPSTNFVVNDQPTDNTAVYTPPADNISPILKTVIANNQPAENSPVYNQPPAHNVQLAMNATGSIPQTMNIGNREPVEPLSPAKNVQQAVNAIGSIPQTTNIWNSQPVESLPPSKHVQPSVNPTDYIPQTTNIWNREPTEPISPAKNVQQAVNATDPFAQTTSIWNREPLEPISPAKNVQAAVNTPDYIPQTTNTCNRGQVEPPSPAKNVQQTVNTTDPIAQTTNIWNREPIETPSVAKNVQQTVNTTDPIAQTTNIWNREPIEPPSAAKNVQQTVNTTDLIAQTSSIWNSQPVESLPPFKHVQPSVNPTGSISLTTNIWNRGPTGNAVTNNTTCNQSVENHIERTRDSNPQKTDNWNSPPVENAIAIANSQINNNRWWENTVAYPQALGRMPSYLQATSSTVPSPPADQSVEEGVPSRCSGLSGYQVDGPVETSVGCGSITMITGAALYSAGGTLSSLVQPAGSFHLHTAGFFQSPINPCSSQLAVFEPSRNASSLAFSDENKPGNPSCADFNQAATNITKTMLPAMNSVFKQPTNRKTLQFSISSTLIPTNQK